MKITNPFRSLPGLLAISITLLISAENVATAGQSASGGAPKDQDVLKTLYTLAEEIRYDFRSTNRGCEWFEVEESEHEANAKQQEQAFKNQDWKDDVLVPSMVKKFGNRVGMNHAIALAVAQRAEETRVDSYRVGNCPEISSTVYAEAFKRCKGVTVGIFRNNNFYFGSLGISPAKAHHFAVVNCGGKLFIADGWVGNGWAVGPLKLDGDKFVDYYTGEPVTDYFNNPVVQLVGWVNSIGTQTF